MLSQQHIALIHALADGEFHSGEQLGEVLGVSRAAICKHIKQLQQYGLHCQRISGRGYQLPGGLELLDSERITAQLTKSEQNKLMVLEIFSVLDSTNRKLLEEVRNQSGLIKAIFAEYQTAGRGRRARHWHGGFAKDLLFSLSWHFPQGVAAMTTLSLAVGVALLTTLQEFGFADLKIKWPNDIYAKNKKLAGILTELHIDTVGCCQVVIGIGLNVELTEAIKAMISQPVIDCKSLYSGKLNRSELAGKLLSGQIQMLERFSRCGFEPFLAQWQAHDLLYGQPVMIYLGEEQVLGIAKGIDSGGGLRVESATAGIQIFHAGEVSVRTQI